MPEDDNIMRLPSPAFEQFQEAINQPSNPNAKLVDLMQGPIPVNVPEVALVGDLGFEDIGAAFNMRDWLQRTLEAQGARKTGAGMGMGVADIDIELEGHHFNVSIRALSRR